mmetsp:Transcript_37492/g.78518  ORF Transcript_37492/g.78518 Transcript_37492/m.78518 type:complete len:93 (+) Transcript_37492:626-904(+)
MSFPALALDLAQTMTCWPSVAFAGYLQDDIVRTSAENQDAPAAFVDAIFDSAFDTGYSESILVPVIDDLLLECLCEFYLLLQKFRRSPQAFS